MTSNIIQAIESNDLAQIIEIVNGGVRFTRHNSPLGIAAELGNVEIVKFLVRSGCKVEWAGALEPSPLYLAASKGHLEVVKLLIDNNAKLDAKDEDGFTPLMSASALGYFEVVKLLVESGAKTNVTNESGDFALLCAASNGHNNIFEYLLPLTSQKLIKILNTCHDFSTVPKSKPSKDYQKLLDAIVNTKLARFDDPQNLGLYINTVNLLIPNVKEFLTSNYTEGTALHQAIGIPEVLTSLLNHGHEKELNILDIDGNIPLICACFDDDLKTVEILLNAGADVNLKNKKHENALFAVVKGHKSNQIIQLLYDNGIDLEATDEFDNTALMIAYSYSKHKNFEQEAAQENVELLISLGAFTSRLLEMDFIYDARNGDNDKVTKFIQDGGNINCKVLNGCSALMGAIDSNKIDTLNLLLSKGALFTDATNAFIYAVSLGYKKVVERLIEVGIDVNIADSVNGVFALSKAVEKNNLDLVSMLLDAGAIVPKEDPIFGDIKKLAKSRNKEIYNLLIKK
jgi:ankyrin repeat protein